MHASLIRYFLLGIVVVMAQAGCTTIRSNPTFDTLVGSANQNIAVSPFEPRAQYHCMDHGFLPCRLNSDTKAEDPSPSLEEDIALQCAKNILPFSEKLAINYIYVEMPIQMMGTTWRDAKANLYRCQSLF